MTVSAYFGIVVQIVEQNEFAREGVMIGCDDLGERQ
jgi:hypothetical protein